MVWVPVKSEQTATWIQIQLDEMYAPFGTQQYDSDPFFVNLQIKDDDLLIKLQEFENNLTTAAVENSKTWFGGKEFSRDKLEMMFTSCIKTFEKHPPMLHVKAESFKISPSTSAKIIMEFGGIWIRRGMRPTWGAKWKISSIC